MRNALLTLTIGLSTLACKDKASGGYNITDISSAVSSDISTVVVVSWNTDEPTTGVVYYGANGAMNEVTAETELGTSHTAYVMAPAESTVDFYISVVSEDGVAAESEELSATTGSLPTDLPTVTTTGDNSDGPKMAVPVLGSVTGPVIFDNAGNYLWYYLADTDLDVYRARLSVDGESLIYNAASVSGDPADDSALVRVKLDGSEVTTTDVPLLAHDFVEHADGTIGTMVVEYRDDENGEAVRGDQIVEIAPDGSQTIVWSAWDCYDPSTHEGEDTGWTFANALDYNADTDKYQLSMRNFSSIIQIDRQTGNCDWGLGGEAATIEWVGDSNPFLHQHQFQDLGDTILVFDNEGAGGTNSRAIEYALDTDAGTAEHIWTYMPDNGPYTFVLGDVNRMDDGTTLVTFSVNGQIDRASASGETLWQLNTGLGAALGFNTILD